MLWHLNRVNDVQDPKSTLSPTAAANPRSFPGAAVWDCVGKELGLRVKSPEQIPGSQPGKGISPTPLLAVRGYPCTPPLCWVLAPGVCPCPGAQP